MMFDFLRGREQRRVDGRRALKAASISSPSSRSPTVSLHVCPLAFSSRDWKICSSFFTWPSASFKCDKMAVCKSGQVAALAIFGNAFTTRRSASYMSASSSRNRSLIVFMFVLVFGGSLIWCNPAAKPSQPQVRFW
jgi:hypothetical protein